jgi:endonuclease/exonuclease/phosphatase family metal-dependent hydrolase
LKSWESTRFQSKVVKGDPGVNVLTWNIQAGIGTLHFRDYLLHAHRQVIHTRSKIAALRHIAMAIARYDVVCLQEIDLGGRRAGFRSQVDAIAAHSGHAHVAVQENRVVPGVSRHGNAIFSHWPLGQVCDLKLPGRIAGRGCLIVDVAAPLPQPLRVACLHLSLGAASQALQLAAIAPVLRDSAAWLAMGDFNCTATSASLGAFCDAAGGSLPGKPAATYPSWRPRHDFDHIIASRALALARYRAEPVHLSDHLPVSAQIVA